MRTYDSHVRSVHIHCIPQTGIELPVLLGWCSTQPRSFQSHSTVSCWRRSAANPAFSVSISHARHQRRRIPTRSFSISVLMSRLEHILALAPQNPLPPPLPRPRNPPPPPLPRPRPRGPPRPPRSATSFRALFFGFGASSISSRSRGSESGRMK